MKSKLPILHFFSVILAFGLLAGCKQTDADTQDGDETVMTSTLAGGEKGYADDPKKSDADAKDAAALTLKLEAEIDEKMRAYNQRPRVKRIGVNPREYRFAQYVESWRIKTERIAELNYPDAARGKMYGSLLLSVTIKKDGTVKKVVIRRSSKYPVLDEAAVRIVRLSEPYAPFPPDITRDTDEIEITRIWTFTNKEPGVTVK
jgi:protein TonB